MNENPVKARLARRKKSRKAGDIEALRLKLWRAVESAETLLYAADDAQTVLRSIHALTQSASAYVKVVEAGEIAARLAEVETWMERHGKLKRVA